VPDRPAYGGAGTPQAETADGWRLSAETTLLLRPEVELERGVERA